MHEPGWLAMKGPKSALIEWLQGLRFPLLLLVISIFWIASVFIPDAIPFVDEILLGLMTVVLSRMKRGQGNRETPKA